MQARTTVPANQTNLLLWALAILGVGLLSLLPLTLLGGGPSPSTSAPASAASRARVAYLEFGRDADTLWLTDTANLKRRDKRLTLSHAAEYGVVPSLAPDRRSFAYTALPANSRGPTPETPADLWLAGVDAGAKPRSVAQGADLLVAPVWSQDGRTLVFRRSRSLDPAAGADSRLFAVDAASGQEHELVAGNGASLFPVAFSVGTSSLYFVRLDAAGSDLRAVDINGANNRLVARLGDGLTRDWKLSSAGDHLAYLAMNLDDGRVASRGQLLDLASGAITPLGPEGDAFSPTWSPSGELVLGSLGDQNDSSAALLHFSASNETRVPTAANGFDVPLGFDPAGGRLAVRNFDGASSQSPGSERLDVIAADGARKTITTAEVTFLGWIDP